MLKLLWLAAVSGVCLLAAQAQNLHAGTVPLFIFNTGVDDAGAPFPDGTIGDPHYTEVLVPGGTTDIRVRTSAGGFPIPPWIGDNSVSAWIGPNNDPQLDGPAGIYGTRTTFTAPALAISATFIGQWAADDEGFDILINGVSTGVTTAFGPLAFTPFNFTAPIHEGMNTFDG